MNEKTCIMWASSVAMGGAMGHSYLQLQSRGLHRHWYWFQFNVFDVRKMNIETQCDVNVTENLNIEFDSMFSMFQCWSKCFNVVFFQILSIFSNCPVWAKLMP